LVSIDFDDLLSVIIAVGGRTFCVLNDAAPSSFYSMSVLAEHR